MFLENLVWARQATLGSGNKNQPDTQSLPYVPGEMIGGHPQPTTNDLKAQQYPKADVTHCPCILWGLLSFSRSLGASWSSGEWALIPSSHLCPRMFFRQELELLVLFFFSPSWWGRVEVLVSYSPDWPWTCYVAKASLEPLVLPPPPYTYPTTGMCHFTQQELDCLI